MGRLATSIGGLGPADPQFQACMDVPNAGVLLALPALIANGLLRHTEKLFQLPRGFYSLYTIFLLVAFTLLARLRSVEGLRYCAPGEWGKLLGVDRIPEVKTLRQKIAHLSQEGKAKEWGATLCKEWMAENPEHAAMMYVDGHVRVYYGDKAHLPKHYVARQKLCLHAVCDYWVNAMDGKPFFLVPKDVDPGLLQVLEYDIVPRLEIDVPFQPDQKKLDQDPFLHRFVLVFDREGYSPDFLLRMKKRRIACLSYNKYPKENWEREEFFPKTVKLVSGEIVDMLLAERGIFLGNKVWVREVRRLMENGHQTAIISTAYRLDIESQAMGMFARWSQENFFKYMRQHFNLDKLSEYGVEEISEEIKVVNPKHRRLDGEIRSKISVLNRKMIRYGSITINGEIEPEKVEEYQRLKTSIQEEIDLSRKEIETLKIERKKTEKHILLSELPEEERFQRLSFYSKDLLDTIKMIAYRAETAMVNILREAMSKEEEARSFVRSLYQTEADIIPNKAEGTLRIRLHHMATRGADEVVKQLCEVLNETRTIFPGTNLRLVYEMVSFSTPRGQEV
jgi:hypothetical protein